MCLVTGLPPLANSLPISSIPNLDFADGHLGCIFVREQARTDHSRTMPDASPVRYQDDHWTSKGIEAGSVASIFGLRWGVASWLNGLLSHVDPVLLLQHFLKKCSRTGFRCIQWWLRFNSCDKPREFHKMCLACTVNHCDLVLKSKFAGWFFGDERVVSSISQALWPMLLPRAYPGTTWFRPGMMLSLSRLFFLSEAAAVGVVFIMFSRDVQSRLVGTWPMVSPSPIVKSLDSSSATSWMNLRETLGSNSIRIAFVHSVPKKD